MSADNAQVATPSKTFVVVSLSGTEPIHLSPRGQRTHHLIKILKTYGKVERIGGNNIPKWMTGDSGRSTSSWYRRFARHIMHSVLIDKYEIAVWRELRGWKPSADGAVLVGYPCSPLPIAARKLTKRGIPYVVDIGDPWILTNPDQEGGWLRRRRARHLERSVWSSAVGAIVTTEGQGDALKILFPHLQVLVRPNGYRPEENVKNLRVIAPSAANRNELRLVHYGSLYGERVDFGKIFQRLVDSNRWDKISLQQYGPDWEGLLTPIADLIEIDQRPPITWEEVLCGAHAFDAAVVIGWSNPARMPSKAIQYLTLPIPRIAMANCDTTDALASYVSNEPGWAVLNGRNGDAAKIVVDHVSKTWTDAELEAPESESWENVEDVLGVFVNEMTAAI